MKRTAQEIITNLRGMFGEQSPDGMVEMLEDITDSVGDFDSSGYVSRNDYDALVTERDTYKTQAEDYRTRYINRFYKNYDEPGNRGVIDGSLEQQNLEKDEKAVSYADLFE